MAKLALADIRIIDSTQIWAGPYCTRLLADLGAEVIKIETHKRPDLVRGPVVPPPPSLLGGTAVYPNRQPGERPWNRSAYFNKVNRNKLEVTLDLSTPEGKEVFLRMVKVGDVVIDNFTVRVMQNFGLTYEVIKAVKPDIIQVRMPGWGMTGPYREYASWGTGVEAMAGMSSLLGYRDGLPMTSSMSYGDPLGGLNAAFAILAAIHYRRQTGQGQFIDVCQIEGAMSMIGEAFMDYSLNGRIPGRLGNRHPSMAPCGAYRAKGDDAWIAIAVANDKQWQALCQVMGKPELAQDKRFADTLGRWHNHDELDKIIEEWTFDRDGYEMMHQLQKVGVAAGPVLKADGVVNEPHLNARGFFEMVNHPDAGRHKLLGVPTRLSKTPGSIRFGAPMLGQHNKYIFKELLGMSDEEIAELEKKGVSSERPIMP